MAIQLTAWKRKSTLPTTAACWLVLSALLPQPLTGTDVPGASDRNQLLPPSLGSSLRYDTEYPAIAYSTTQPSGVIARLQKRLDRREVVLEFNERNGYLQSLLRALDIDAESQILVFSRTSVNAAHIRSETPRAIYFNDNAYVGWVPDSGAIEVASMDPNLGPLFYRLEQRPADEAGFERQAGQCLRCHDSRTLTGGGVPRFILGSGYVDRYGNLVSHEGWVLTNQETPLKYRWGGWYVTGQHGEQKHLGNIIIQDPDDLSDLDSLRLGNLDSLEAFVDTTHYASNESDIVALLVIEHQVHVQNLFTRINYDVRSALLDEQRMNANSSGEKNSSVSNETKRIVESAVDYLIKTMLFTNAATFASPIRGSTAFASRFEKRGPYDSRGRSLRTFDLDTRIFRYPLSYLVYSDAFDALPRIVREAFYRQLDEVLRSEQAGEDFAHLSPEVRLAVFEIMRDTKPAFAAAIRND